MLEDAPQILMATRCPKDSLSLTLAHREESFEDGPTTNPTLEHKQENVQDIRDMAIDNPSEASQSHLRSSIIDLEAREPWTRAQFDQSSWSTFAPVGVRPHWEPLPKSATKLESLKKPDTSGHAKFSYSKDQPGPLEKAADGTWRPKAAEVEREAPSPTDLPSASKGLSLLSTGVLPTSTGLQLSSTCLPPSLRGLPSKSKGLPLSSGDLPLSSGGLLQDNKCNDNTAGELRGGARGDNGRRKRIWEKIKSGAKKVKAFFTRQPAQTTRTTGTTGTTGTTENIGAAGTAGTAGTTGVTGITRTTGTGERPGSLHSIAVSHSSGGPPIPILPRRSSRRRPSQPLLAQQDAELQQDGGPSSGRLRGGAGEGDDGRRRSMWQGLKEGAKKARTLFTRSPGTQTTSTKKQNTPLGKQTTFAGTQTTTTGSGDYELTTLPSTTSPQRTLRRRGAGLREAGDGDGMPGSSNWHVQSTAAQIIAKANERDARWASDWRVRSIAQVLAQANERDALRAAASDPDVLLPLPTPPIKVMRGGPRVQVVHRRPKVVQRPPHVRKMIPLTGTGFEYYSNTKFLEHFRARPIETYLDYAGPPIEKKDKGKDKGKGKGKDKGKDKGKGKAKEEVPTETRGAESPIEKKDKGKGKGKAKEEVLVEKKDKGKGKVKEEAPVEMRDVGAQP